MRSSAKRDRCVMHSAAQNCVSATKSRSETASMELGQTPPKNPRSAASARRSTPNGLPASAPEPSGSCATRASSCPRQVEALPARAAAPEPASRYIANARGAIAALPLTSSTSPAVKAGAQAFSISTVMGTGVPASSGRPRMMNSPTEETPSSDTRCCARGWVGVGAAGLSGRVGATGREAGGRGPGA